MNSTIRNLAQQLVQGDVSDEERGSLEAALSSALDNNGNYALAHAFEEADPDTKLEIADILADPNAIAGLINTGDAHAMLREYFLDMQWSNAPFADFMVDHVIASGDEDLQYIVGRSSGLTSAQALKLSKTKSGLHGLVDNPVHLRDYYREFLEEMPDQTTWMTLVTCASYNTPDILDDIQTMAFRTGNFFIAWETFEAIRSATTHKYLSLGRGIDSEWAQAFAEKAFENDCVYELEEFRKQYETQDKFTKNKFSEDAVNELVKAGVFFDEQIDPILASRVVPKISSGSNAFDFAMKKSKIEIPKEVLQRELLDMTGYDVFENQDDVLDALKVIPVDRQDLRTFLNYLVIAMNGGLK